ncbi:hypothetical protein MASR2M79_18270 [Aminivibrio sp.]
MVPRHCDEGAVHHGLFGDPVIHNLEKEVVFAHDIPVEDCPAKGLLLLPLDDEGGDLSGDAGR